MFKPHPSISLLQILFSHSPSLHSLSLFSHILPSSLPCSLLLHSLTHSFLLPQIKLYRGRIHGQPPPLPLTPPPLSHLIARCCHHSFISSPSLAPTLPLYPERAVKLCCVGEDKRGGLHNQQINNPNVITRVFLYFL